MAVRLRVIVTFKEGADKMFIRIGLLLMAFAIGLPAQAAKIGTFAVNGNRQRMFVDSFTATVFSAQNQISASVHCVVTR